MTQYIDKSALVAEIEKRINNTGDTNQWLCGKLEVYREIHDFIDTFEVKEVDSEEKATQLSQKYFPDEENIWARANIEAHKCKSACIEMVEWFKAQKGE